MKTLSTDHLVTELYQSSELPPLSEWFARIDYLSQVFLGCPYIANPQGEGAVGEFDQAPLYRFDGFDCVTFVNNILALTLSRDLNSFQKNLLQINYYDEIACYENRFHFMSLDWNIQNQKNNIVCDVTCEIVDEKNNMISDFVEGDIDKPNWFLKKRENETDDRKKLLKKYSVKFKKEFVRLPYLPLTKLFDKNNNSNEFIFNQIPPVSIIEIVRPNWNLKEKIGTNLHVSHIGFSIRKPSGELFFRHASSENKCVIEISLTDYLKNALDSTTIQGINVQKVVSVLDVKHQTTFQKARGILKNISATITREKDRL